MRLADRHRKFWVGGLAVLLSTMVPARGEESDRVYSLAEVSAIDRENKLWRAVDVTRSVEFNVDRWLAGGCSPAVVDTLKPRLAAMWQVEPWLYFGWLAPGTAESIQELTPDYTIRLKEARVREMLNRLGGEHDPLTPTQVKAQWRTAILKVLDERERKDFVLLNSAPALALYDQLKGQVLTTDERRSLCLLQQDHLGALQQLSDSRSYLSTARIDLNRAEALLDYWQQMRDLLGDDRFSAYLQAAEPRFGKMAGVLNQIEGVTNTKVLDLWWVRKKDEMADVQLISGSERYQLKIKAEESAAAILGSDAVGKYEANEEAKWLRRNLPQPVYMKKGRIAQNDGKAGGE